jgi:hypothetical protein
MFSAHHWLCTKPIKCTRSTHCHASLLWCILCCCQCVDYGSRDEEWFEKNLKWSGHGLIHVLPGGTEENLKKPHGSQCPGWDLNQAPPEYKCTKSLLHQPFQSVPILNAEIIIHVTWHRTIITAVICSKTSLTSFILNMVHCMEHICFILHIFSFSSSAGSHEPCNSCLHKSGQVT